MSEKTRTLPGPETDDVGAAVRNRRILQSTREPALHWIGRKPALEPRESFDELVVVSTRGGTSLACLVVQIEQWVETNYSRMNRTARQYDAA